VLVKAPLFLFPHIKKALKPSSGVVHTLTADNGKEFAMHEKIADSLKANVYFAKNLIDHGSEV